MNISRHGLARTTRNAALAATLLTMVTAPAVHADGKNRRHSSHSFTDYARVVDVNPIYSKIAYEKPIRECWLEEQQHTTVYEGNAHGRRSHNTGGTIAGGVIGGVIGNQLGKRGNSTTRFGATVVGAIIGSAIANEGPQSNHRRHRRPNQHQSRPVQRPVQSRPVERCTTQVTTEYRREISGYQVTYRYKGQTFTTRTDRDPGDRIPISISIRPLNR